MMLPVHDTTGHGGGRRAKELDCQRKRSLLLLLDLHHEALDIATIPADFCAESTRPNLLHCPVSDLVEPDFLSCHRIRGIVPMLTKRKDLESVGSWHMSQLWCYFNLWCHNQHYLRLFDSGPPSVFYVAIADGHET